MRIIIVLWGVLAGFIILNQSLDLFKKGIPSISHYFALRGNADALRRALPIYHKFGIEARESLPPGACVETPAFPTTVTLEEIAFRYELFPIKSLNTWPTLFNASPHCNKVYKVDLHRPILSRPAVRPYPRLRIWGGFIFIIFLSVVIGEAVWTWISPSVLGDGFWQHIATSYLLGSVVGSLIYWVLLLFNLPLSRLILAVMAICFLPKAISSWAYRFKSWDKSIHVPSLSWLLILKVITVLLVTFYVLYIVSFPISIWDEMYIWLLKAKMFFEAHGLAFDYSVYDHNYYPILWPLYIALEYTAIGGIYDEVTKWTAAIIFLAMLMQIFSAAKALGLNRFCQWAVIFVYLSCCYHGTMFTALPENFYIALSLMAFIFFLRWKTAGKTGPYRILFIILLGLAALKVEGVLVAVLCFLALFASYIPKLILRRGSILLLVCSLPLLWQVWLRWRHIPFGVFHLQGWPSFMNVGKILKIILFLMCQWPNAEMILLVLISWVWFTHRRMWQSQEIMLAVFCIGLVVFSLLSGLFWKSEFFEYFPEALTRLFARAVPFLILLWISRLNGAKIGPSIPPSHDK